MTRSLALAVVALASFAACGGDGRDVGARPPQTTAPRGGGGLSLTVRHPEPLRQRAPVTWTLEVRNDGPAGVTLVLPSGQRGDVVLRQGSVEHYRWSRGRAFTQELGELRLGPGEARSFDLRDQRFDVPPGEYELVASLTSRPAPPEVTKQVIVGSR